jgi:EpsI family protein
VEIGVETRSLMVAALLCVVGSLRGLVQAPPPSSARTQEAPPRLPMVIGPWKGRELAVPAWLHREIPASRIVSRIYQNGRGQQVHMYFITSTKPQAFHRATICYPGQGWRIEGRRLLALANGRATAEALVVNRKGVRMATLGWYQSGRRVTPNVHVARLWLRLGRLLHNSADPGRFVRLATPLSPQAGSEESGLSLLTGFADRLLAALHSRGAKEPSP